MNPRDFYEYPTIEEQQRVLHAPFDIMTHMKTFVEYLEVIIHPNGTVEYAVPSHVLKLQEIYGKTSDEMFEEFYNSLDTLCEPAEWLCKKTGCISVWNNGYAGTANEAQKEALRKLKEYQLYKGEIEK